MNEVWSPSIVLEGKSSWKVPFSEPVSVSWGESSTDLAIVSNKAEVASIVKFPGMFVGWSGSENLSTFFKAECGGNDSTVIRENPIGFNQLLFSQSWLIPRNGLPFVITFSTRVVSHLDGEYHSYKESKDQQIFHDFIICITSVIDDLYSVSIYLFASNIFFFIFSGRLLKKEALMLSFFLIALQKKLIKDFCCWSKNFWM